MNYEIIVSLALRLASGGEVTTSELFDVKVTTERELIEIATEHLIEQETLFQEPEFLILSKNAKYIFPIVCERLTFEISQGELGAAGECADLLVHEILHDFKDTKYEEYMRRLQEIISDNEPINILDNNSAWFATRMMKEHNLLGLSEQQYDKLIEMSKSSYLYSYQFLRTMYNEGIVTADFVEKLLIYKLLGLHTVNGASIGNGELDHLFDYFCI